MRRILIFSLACVGTWLTLANDAVKPNPIKEALLAVPAPELPARAAQFVREARPKEREDVTTTVILASVQINPAAAPTVVGAIARVAPEMAPQAAGLAAAAQPKLAAAIARSAAASAPSMAGKIVEAVCKAVPHDYRAVASAVAEMAPGSGKEILDGVANGVPQLAPAISSTVIGYNGTIASVPAALDQAAHLSAAQPAFAATPQVVQGNTVSRSPTLAQNTPSPAPQAPASGPAAPRPRPPSVGPPYIPLSGTPTNATPGTGGEVPPGGRNYAEP